MKKILSFILVISMVLSTFPASSVYSFASDTQIESETFTRETPVEPVASFGSPKSIDATYYNFTDIKFAEQGTIDEKFGYFSVAVDNGIVSQTVSEYSNEISLVKTTDTELTFNFGETTAYADIENTVKSLKFSFSGATSQTIDVNVVKGYTIEDETSELRQYNGKEYAYINSAHALNFDDVVNVATSQGALLTQPQTKEEVQGLSTLFADYANENQGLSFVNPNVLMDAEGLTLNVDEHIVFDGNTYAVVDDSHTETGVLLEYNGVERVSLNKTVNSNDLLPATRTTRESHDYYVSSKGNYLTETGTVSDPYSSIPSAMDQINADTVSGDKARILVMDDLPAPFTVVYSPNAGVEVTVTTSPVQYDDGAATTGQGYDGLPIAENTRKTISHDMDFMPLFILDQGKLIFEDIIINGNGSADQVVSAAGGTLEMQDCVQITNFVTEGNAIIDILGTANLIVEKDGAGNPLVIAPVGMANTSLDPVGPIFYGNTLDASSIIKISGTGKSDIHCVSFGIEASPDMLPNGNVSSGGYGYSGFVYVTDTLNVQTITDSTFFDVFFVDLPGPYEYIINVRTGGKLDLKNVLIYNYDNVETAIWVENDSVLTADDLKIGKAGFPNKSQFSALTVSQAEATLTNSKINNNESDMGDSNIIILSGATLTMTNTEIKDNKTGMGKSIIIELGYSQVTFEDVVVTGNTSGHTIDISELITKFTMKNTNVTGNNLVDNTGKAVYNNSTQLFFDETVNIKDNDEVTPDPLTDNNLWLPATKHVVLKSESAGTIKYDTEVKPNVGEKITVAITNTSHTVSDTDKTKFEYFASGYNDVIDGTGVGDGLGGGAKLVLEKNFATVAPTVSDVYTSNVATTVAPASPVATDDTFIQSPGSANQDSNLYVVAKLPAAEPTAKISFAWYEDKDGDFNPLSPVVDADDEAVLNGDSATLYDSTSTLYNATTKAYTHNFAPTDAENTTTSDDVKKYYCIVTNTNADATLGTTANAGSTLLTVTTNKKVDTDAPMISTQPVGYTEIVGKHVVANDTKLTATATATSQKKIDTTTSLATTPFTPTAGMVSYKWYTKPFAPGDTAESVKTSLQSDLSMFATETFVDVPAANISADTKTVTVPNPADNTTTSDDWYFCVAINTNNALDGTKTAYLASDIVEVKIVSPIGTGNPTISTQPLGYAEYLNEPQTTNKLTVTATAPILEPDGVTAGADANLKYQWNVDVDGDPATTGDQTAVTAIDGVGGTTASFTPANDATSIADTKNYFCHITNENTSPIFTGVDGFVDSSMAKVILKDKDPTSTPSPTSTPTSTPSPTPTSSPKPVPTVTGNGNSSNGGGSDEKESTVFATPKPTTVEPTIPTQPTDPTNAYENNPNKTGVSTNLNTIEHIEFVVGSDDKFRPDEGITRAEVAQMYYGLLLEKNPDADSMANFDDVSPEDWYYEAVTVLASQGVLNGYPDGSFKPNEPITRAEFVTIACTFGNKIDGDKSFTDVSDDHWATYNIEMAAEYGWVTGYEDGTFKPDNDITRAEGIVIVENMTGRIPDESFIDENVENKFVDVTKYHWAYYDIMEATYEHEYETVDGEEVWTELK